RSWWTSRPQARLSSRRFESYSILLLRRALRVGRRYPAAPAESVIVSSGYAIASPKIFLRLESDAGVEDGRSLLCELLPIFRGTPRRRDHLTCVNASGENADDQHATRQSVLSAG